MTLRVLFLTCHLPFPPISGGRHREFELLRRIGGQVDVSVCAVTKTWAEDVSNAGALASYCSDVQVVPADPPRSTEGAMPFQVLRHRSRHVRPVLADGDYDVIHVEGFYLMQHLRALAPRPTVLVEQNIEYQLWEQRAAHASGPAAWRHRREAERTRRAELDAWRRADVVGALTAEDRDVIVRAGVDDVALVPDGIAVPEGEPVPTDAEAPPVMTFVGNFAYEPNVDAALYFARSVMPRVLRAVPDARLMLVGNAPPPQVQALANHSITVTGRVPDIGEYLVDTTAVVCPLRVGGGVKVKMLEALAHGKAIVSTSIGTQGLGPNGEDAVAVADTSADMAAEIVDVLCNPERRHGMEAAAAKFAAALPTWDDAAASLLSCYERAVSGRRRLHA
jgi:glycosyltransferase involved in cell wall biosynthesis